MMRDRPDEAIFGCGGVIHPSLTTRMVVVDIGRH